MIQHAEIRDLFDYNPLTGILTWRRTGRRAGCKNDRGYRTVRVAGECYREHRVIWFWMTGEWPPEQLDHDNRVRDDNRWENLKLASQTINQRNRTLQRNNTSGTPGVAWHERDKRWCARVKSDGKYVHLGSFHTKEEAIDARKTAEMVWGFHAGYGSEK